VIQVETACTSQDPRRVRAASAGTNPNFQATVEQIAGSVINRRIPMAKERIRSALTGDGHNRSVNISNRLDEATQWMDNFNLLVVGHG